MTKILDLKSSINPKDDDQQPRKIPVDTGPSLVHANPLLPGSDFANSRALVERHGKDLRYVPNWGWLVWDGTRWVQDCNGEVERRARETILALSWHEKDQSYARVRVMISLAVSEPEVVALPEQFDRDPFLLNVKNGTIDLRTGKKLRHRRRDLITKITPAAYDDTAECPLWQKFLHRTTGGSEDLQDYLQRVVGYALTSDTSELCMFIIWGSGRNGKTVFLETIKDLLGEYAMSTPVGTLLDTGRTNENNTFYALARFRGARYVIASETGHGKRIHEALVKILTGRDTIVARPMYKELFEFRPECKIFLCTNHWPQVRGTDVAIWERLKLIPFNVYIPEEERDKQLAEKLRHELPGILNWAIQGCLEWQKVGLNEPEEVLKATKTYREEHDPVGRFIKERCLHGEDRQTLSALLYTAYQGWCGENDAELISRRSFGMELAQRGFTGYRVTQGEHKGKKGWKGISLPPVSLKPSASV